jgi:FMN-dependent NADH-azoreductase
MWGTYEKWQEQKAKNEIEAHVLFEEKMAELDRQEEDLEGLVELLKATR